MRYLHGINSPLGISDKIHFAVKLYVQSRNFVWSTCSLSKYLIWKRSRGQLVLPQPLKTLLKEIKKCCNWPYSLAVNCFFSKVPKRALLMLWRYPSLHPMSNWTYPLAAANMRHLPHLLHTLTTTALDNNLLNFTFSPSLCSFINILSGQKRYFCSRTSCARQN